MVLKLDLHLSCNQCDMSFLVKDLQKAAEEGFCPNCERKELQSIGRRGKSQETVEEEDWTIRGLIYGKETDWGASLDGLSLIAMGGFENTSEGIERLQSSKVVLTEHSFEISGISDLVAEHIMACTEQQRIELIFQLMEEQRKKETLRSGILRSINGVHCFQCHERFIPGVLLAKHGLIRDQIFTHNLYCSPLCMSTFAERQHTMKCRACGQKFTKPSGPKDPMLSRKWKLRPYYAAGYCSNGCFTQPNQNTCRVCKKVYQISKVDYLPKLKKLIELQKKGFCTLVCHDKSAKTVVPSDEPVDDCSLIKVLCPKNHAFGVPREHSGYITLCSTCHCRVKIQF
jgi:hypothetical protein